jgi:hypothetical protein
MTAPSPFPRTFDVNDTGYDATFVSTLPEFAHWNDPNFGEEALSYDDCMLRVRRVSIVNLFLRGAVTTEWYDVDTNVPTGVL